MDLANLYIKERRYFMKVIYKYGLSEIGEDIIQEAFYHALRGIETFKGECTGKSWVTSILINECLQVFRNRKREREIIFYEEGPIGLKVVESDENDGMEKLLVLERCKEVHRKVLQLNRNQREALVRYYWMGVDGRRPRDKSHRWRGIKRLREMKWER
jgi:RNA polymerase sigma factor (sigma-70 family)